MVYHEIAKYFNNESGVNEDRLYAEVEMMLYAAAKKVGIRLQDRDQAADLRSALFLHIWEIPKNKPLNKKWIEAFSKAKNLVFSVCDQPEIAVETDCMVNMLKEERQAVEEDFYSDLHEQVIARLDAILVHPRIKTFLTNLIRRHKNDMLDFITSPTFLGNLLKVLFVQERFFGLYHRHEYGEISGLEYLLGDFKFLKDREKEVFLSCLLTKAGKWTLSEYILIGDMFFVFAVMFLPQRMPPQVRVDMQNMLNSVRVHCFVEGCRNSGTPYNEACRKGAKRFGIRFKHVQERYRRIRRLLDQYEQFARKCVDSLRRDAIGIEKRRQSVDHQAVAK